MRVGAPGFAGHYEAVVRGYFYFQDRHRTSGKNGEKATAILPGQAISHQFVNPQPTSQNRAGCFFAVQTLDFQVD